MKFLTSTLAIVLSFGVIAYAQSDEGLVVIIASDTIGTYQQDSNKIIAQSSLLQFDNNIQETIPESGIHLSPDGETLALMQPDRNLLVLTEIDTGKQQAIQMEPATEGYILHGWSPNSHYFSLSDRATRIYYIVDAIEVTLNSVDVLNVSTQVVWTSDSSQVIFKGSDNCINCLIQGQFYILDMKTLKTSSILDKSAPELTDFDWNPRANPYLGKFDLYGSVLFFEVSESTDLPGNRTNLYSFDLQTQQVGMTNLDSLFPENTLGISIRDMWYSEDINRLNVLVFFDANPGSGWGIASWNPNELAQVVYQKLFLDGIVDIQYIASTDVSIDGRQIAIAALEATYQQAGSITVIDVVAGQEVWYERFDQPVCQVEMPADNLVVYGLVAGRCENLTDTVKKVNQVSSYNLLTQEQTMLIESETSVLFVSPEQ